MFVKKYRMSGINLVDIQGVWPRIIIRQIVLNHRFPPLFSLKVVSKFVRIVTYEGSSFPFCQENDFNQIHSNNRKWEVLEFRNYLISVFPVLFGPRYSRRNLLLGFSHPDLGGFLPRLFPDASFSLLGLYQLSRGGFFDHVKFTWNSRDRHMSFSM